MLVVLLDIIARYQMERLLLLLLEMLEEATIILAVLLDIIRPLWIRI